MTDQELLSEMGTDGNLWATAFCERFPEVDFGTALSWFCNAIEAGRAVQVREVERVPFTLDEN